MRHLQMDILLMNRRWTLCLLIVSWDISLGSVLFTYVSTFILCLLFILKFAREMYILAILDIFCWIVSLVLRSCLDWLLEIGILYLILINIQMTFINLSIRLFIILIIVAASILFTTIIISLILMFKAIWNLLMFI